MKLFKVLIILLISSFSYYGVVDDNGEKVTNIQEIMQEQENEIVVEQIVEEQESETIENIVVEKEEEESKEKIQQEEKAEVKKEETNVTTKQIPKTQTTPKAKNVEKEEKKVEKVDEIKIEETTKQVEIQENVVQEKKVEEKQEEKVVTNAEKCATGNHGMGVGNSGKWFKTKDEAIATFTELELGKYYIQEKEQVNGYILNDTVYEVEIKQDGDILVITCENKPTNAIFSKVDETGVQEMAGAIIQIIDKETNEIVDEWVSTNESHIVNYLVEGKEYIMKETSAPYGYQIAEEITFVMGDNIKVTMKNNPIVKTLQLTKIDKETKEIIKERFTFGLYVDKECTQLIQQMDSNAKEGTVTFKDVRYGTYYIKEISAPNGYVLSDKVIKVEINDKGVFVDKKEIEENNSIYNFEFANKKIETPKTSDESNAILLIILIGVSTVTLLSLGVYEIKKRKNK